MSQEAVADLLDADDSSAAWRGSWRTYEEASTSRSGASRYFFQEPSVRSAVCAALDRASERIAPLLLAHRRDDRRRRPA